LGGPAKIRRKRVDVPPKRRKTLSQCGPEKKVHLHGESVQQKAETVRQWDQTPNIFLKNEVDDGQQEERKECVF